MEVIQLQIVSEHFNIGYPLIFSDSLYQTIVIQDTNVAGNYGLIWDILSNAGYPENLNAYYTGEFRGLAQYTSSTIFGILSPLFPNATFGTVSSNVHDDSVSINGKILELSYVVAVNNEINSEYGNQNRVKLWSAFGCGLGWSVSNTFGFKISILPESSYSNTGIIVNNTDKRPRIYRYSVENGVFKQSATELVSSMPQSIIDFWGSVSPPAFLYPITYRLTNATTTGPNEAAVGDTITVPLTFPEGYGVVNPSSDAYVTCNGVLVPSTYSNGQLVFTMPDPS